jgi:predicted aminopeptidase
MCSTLKSQENIQKAYMKKETETEIKYFIKEKKTETETIQKTTSLTQKLRKKLQNTDLAKTRKIAHHKLALKSNNSNPRNVNIEPAKHSQKPAQPEPLTLVIRIASR